MSLTLPSDIYKRIKLTAYKPPYKIDIGCGPKCAEGFIGIDVQDHGQEILWDVTQGIPLSNDSVERIQMWQFLEHIEYKDLDAFFRDIRRVCSKKATIDIKVPYADHPAAYALPHVSFWDEKAFKGMVAGFINSKKERLPVLEIVMMQLLENSRILHVKLRVIR